MKKSIGLLSVMLIVLAYTSFLNAGIIYPLNIFANNGNYYNNSVLNFVLGSSLLDDISEAEGKSKAFIALQVFVANII